MIRRLPMRFVKPVMDNGEMRIADLMLFVGQKGQQLYFLNTENCLIFASAEGEDSERMRGCGGEG